MIPLSAIVVSATRSLRHLQLKSELTCAAVPRCLTLGDAIEPHQAPRNPATLVTPVLPLAGTTVRHAPMRRPAPGLRQTDTVGNDMIDAASLARTACNESSERAFLAMSLAVFVASAAATIAWCGSMATMGDMPMPGGWTMSMVWMRMPGQTWTGAALSFLGMWAVMMLAMMLPSLVPMLSRYRQAVSRRREPRLGRFTTLVALGYFVVWILFGLAIFPLGVALASVEMQEPALARAVPIASGLVLWVAGALQFTAWKSRHLAGCRGATTCGHTLGSGAGAAWQHGLRLGLQCSLCCGNLMLITLVAGVMDLRVMALVTAAITIERLAPAAERVAHAIGAGVIVAGLLLIARAAGFQ